MNKIVPGEDHHLNSMLGRMRAEDRHEIIVGTGRNPDVVLAESWGMTVHRWAVLHDDEVACLLGVMGLTMLGQIGVPWLLGTDLIDEMKFFFARESRKYVRKMLELYPMLINYVDASYTKSIQWLKFCGFRLYESEPYGIDGAPFIRFELERKYYGMG